MSREEMRERLEKLAARDVTFDGSLWELDGWTAEDARRAGHDDGQIELARDVLALLEQEPVAWRCELRSLRGSWVEDLTTADRSVVLQWEREQHGNPGTHWRVTPLVPALTRGRRDDE